MNGVAWWETTAAWEGVREEGRREGEREGVTGEEGRVGWHW